FPDAGWPAWPGGVRTLGDHAQRHPDPRLSCLAYHSGTQRCRRPGARPDAGAWRAEPAGILDAPDRGPGLDDGSGPPRGVLLVALVHAHGHPVLRAPPAWRSCLVAYHAAGGATYGGAAARGTIRSFAARRVPHAPHTAHDYGPVADRCVARPDTGDSRAPGHRPPGAAALGGADVVPAGSPAVLGPHPDHRGLTVARQCDDDEY